MKAKAIILMAFILITSSNVCRSEIAVDGNEEKTKESITSAKIIFSGDVNAKKMVELTQALNALNQNYSKLNTIYLYINSFGGDLNSAVMGYHFIKSSSVNVVAINTSTIASAATLLYCAAKDRMTMKHSSFTFHAPALYIDAGYIQPDALEIKTNQLRSYNTVLNEIYNSCIELSDSEKAKVLHSEGALIEIDSAKAIKHKLSTKVVDKMATSYVNYYIYD